MVLNAQFDYIFEALYECMVNSRFLIFHVISRSDENGETYLMI